MDTINIIKPSIEFVDGKPEEEMIKYIERIARTCYKSENKITEESGKKMIRHLFKSGHMPMFDHVTITYKVICDRGVTHEIVRHRHGAYAQESTRYCNYTSEKFDGKITVIDLATGFKYNLDDEIDSMKYMEWKAAMVDAANHYNKMIELGATPQEARSVLPNSLKTEIVITYDITEWFHFFKLRYFGQTGMPHPQMFEISKMIFEDFKKRYPFISEQIGDLIIPSLSVN